MVFRWHMISLALGLLLSGSLCRAAGAPAGLTEDGGLEQQAQIGEWIKPGKRGGALRVSGDAQKASALDKALSGQAGSVTMLVRIDAPGNNGGIVFAAGQMELAKLAGTSYLEFRVGSKAVRKTIYDWFKGSWYHLTLSWEHGVPALFVDGEPGSAPYDGHAVGRRDGVFLGGGLGTTSFDEIFPAEAPITEDAAAKMAKISHAGSMVVKPVSALTITKTAKAPVLDGTLAPGEWDHAAGAANFVHNFAGHLSSHPTWMWAMYDDAKVYLAFKTPVTKPLRSYITERDGGIFGDDCYELFFMPNPSGELEYYQLGFTAIGTLFDGRITTASWNGEWQVKNAVDGQWWTAEFAVPYTGINALPAKTGHRWKFSVCHAGTQWTQTGMYHNANQFGLLKFREHGPVVNIGQLERHGDTIAIPYTVIGDIPEGLVLKADCYAGGLRPTVSKRLTVDKASATGALVLQGVTVPAGSVAIDAFTDASDPLFTQFINFNATSFEPYTFLADQPDGPKNPIALRPTVEAPKPEPAPGPAPDVKKPEYRPSIDEIEKLLVEQQQWLGNSIGKRQDVPPPWTPMTVAKNTVKCWAKEFDFNRGAGLPQQARVLDADLFAAPVAFVSRTKSTGKPTLFVKARKETDVTLIGRQDFGNVTVTTETRIEFDGFARVDVTLSPHGGKAELNTLTLRLPFKPAHAKYYSWWGSNAYGSPTWEDSNFLTGKKTAAFRASVWVGDEDRGFCWFTEAPENWSHPDDTDLIEITPGKKSTDLLIHLLKGTQVIDKPVTFTFGWMATPAKPRPAHWRTWEGKLGQIWGWETAFSAAHVPNNVDSFKNRVKSPFALPMLSCFFAGTAFIKDGHPTPEQWLWNHLWSTRGDLPRSPLGLDTSKDTQGRHIRYDSMAMASSWPDYYVYKLKEMREKYGVRSVYLDTCVRAVNNPLAGMTWTDREGKTRSKIDIFAFREMSRRIYNFIHEDPEGHVMMHHSNQVAIPLLSFMDTHMNGEHFNTGPHQVGGRNYTDVLPVGTMRACYTLKQWGVVPSFLPEHPANTRNMLGYFWVHDTPIYQAWCDHAIYTRSVRAKQSFGLGDVDFLPYWEQDAPAAAQPEQIFISAYRKQDRSAAMVIIANMQQRDREITVVLHEKSLGMQLAGRTVQGIDLEYGEAFAVKDGVFTLPVKRSDFRMIKIVP